MHNIQYSLYNTILDLDYYFRARIRSFYLFREYSEPTCTLQLSTPEDTRMAREGVYHIYLCLSLKVNVCRFIIIIYICVYDTGTYYIRVYRYKSHSAYRTYHIGYPYSYWINIEYILYF